MKAIILGFFLFILSFSAFAQETLVDRIMLEESLLDENVVEDFQEHNFSDLWTQSPCSIVLGIIGSKHKRILIKLISVAKATDQLTYQVYGKSCVDGNICDFNGTIIIKQIYQLKELHYGVDDQYKDTGIKSQGLLVADYHFDENMEQNHSGTFSGKLYSKWYLDKSDKILYDDLQSQSDGYMNNAFVGNWTSSETKKSRICNWADFRVPECKADFDIGAGEFFPSEKYHSQGWGNYPDTTELDEWWK